MSFYRIYRPQIIADIDNTTVRDSLLSLLSKKLSDLPHAFLFSGPKGTGKTTAARIVAKLFNCEKNGKSGPCGKCGRCLSIGSGSDMDVLEMDAASNRGIDEVRTLRDGIYQTPSNGEYKIYIIDEVHMMTTEAFNALLKILEEPPAHAVFVLATTDPQKVPATVRSRCIHIRFDRAGLDETKHALIRIADAEKLSLDDNASTFLAELSDGSFRDAVKMLEQVSLQTKTVTLDVVQKTFGIQDESAIGAIVDSFITKDTEKGLKFIQSLTQSGADMKTVMTLVIERLERMLVTSLTKTLPMTKSQLSMLLKNLTESYALFRYSPIPALPLEIALVEYCDTPTLLTQPEKYSAPQVISKIQNHDEIKHDLPKETELQSVSNRASNGLLTIGKLVDCWKDVIESCKPHNHSVAGVLRSARPKSVENGVVTIETFYPFHQEKLSESKARDILTGVMKKLFGDPVKVQIVLGKK